MPNNSHQQCSISGIEDYPLGCTVSDKNTLFRLFSPKAHFVEVVIFEQYEDEEGLSFVMEKNHEGVWSCLIQDVFPDHWYAYKIQGPVHDHFFLSTDEFIADPRSRHVTTRNHYLQYPKTRICNPTEFDWEDDTFVVPEDPRDLIIYETHIKDLVAHSSAKTKVNGIYNDFREAEVGGVSHLKRLGVNAVEFLPLQKFAYFEPPFNETVPNGIKNVWNPYSINYWGYMTSFHFAPETVYASDATLELNKVNGSTVTAEHELKELVKALHKENITVLMDVVYNHASHYDLNPLKYTAKDHYFSLDDSGNFTNDSWTGNDIDTTARYSRELIVESIKYWMKEYHIDGFRFDLAGIIDWETVDLIREEAHKINPNVLLIAEPWGKEYKPDGFSDHGWSSWNDRFRNTIKGYNPKEDKGLIFGNTGHNTRFGLENLIRGTLRSGENGLFHHSGHSVNYLESHDGYTLGDYIRIALDPEKADKVFEDVSHIADLNTQEESIAKLAALVLFVSQGITMMHAGQEWARSKIIRDPKNIDSQKGKIDRDTYNKDDRTNWLNFNEIQINQSLFNYYKGLIKLRLNAPAFRRSNPEDIHFKVYNDPLHITFSIDGKSSGDMYNYFVSLNASLEQDYEIILPEGYWEIVADDQHSGIKTLKSVKTKYNVPASSGIILRKLRVSKA
ncbi:alpha-amylase family glycosyl hydrolase [Gracilimonas amylolytica]|uniref:alpha-amylase family glycosyl hydrolase n=1 Tax=Gracilimonas amylolytica TaxID=1749045 RepID=UPI000CD89EC3|nr:alpha-amylase family glycosyl hydrolase [Gracilimonas amylolytica]